MALKIASNNSGSSSRGGSKGGSFSGRSGSVRTLKTPAKKTFNKPSAAPATNTSTSSTRSYSQGGTFPVQSFGDVAPAAPAMPTEADYLAGDSTYQATLAALKKQLQNFTSDIGSQRSNRALDYNKSLKDLGYIAPDPNARSAGGPSWNWNDTLTASGRANQNQLNDFAARGMLQSSGYADSFQDLTRSLMDQYTGIDQANTQFNTDHDRQLARAKDENTSASQAARAEAIMRRAAQYGFGV